MKTNNSLPSWDLTQYYNSHKDSQIYADLDEMTIKICEFVENYRGKMHSLVPSEIASLLESYEGLYAFVYKPEYYLGHILDAGGEEAGVIEQAYLRVKTKTAQASKHLVFVERELMDRGDLGELMRHDNLTVYSYYLELLMRKKPHTLSEEVEQVIAIKDVTGFDAWAKFYQDQKANISIESDIEGETKTYRFVDLTQLIIGTNRDLRSKAWDLRAQELAKKEENTLIAFNNVLMERQLSDELRGYDDPESEKLIENQVSQSFVDSLQYALKQKLPMVKRFLKLKKEALGVDIIKSYDLFAEVSLGGGDTLYSWEEARDVILKAFGEFDSGFHDIAQKFFDHNWIDADPSRQKKLGGAYQSQFVPGYHPIIFTNYKGTMTDVITLAHELGHGIHSYLMMENQNTLNCEYPMSTAEIASTTCETIVFNKLYESLESLEEKLNLLFWKVDEDMRVLFQVGLGRYQFEKKAHAKFRRDGPLSQEFIRELCLEEVYKNIYGDSVQYDHRAGYNWQYVAHNVYIFYNYVYASGNLLALSIYQKVNEKPDKVELYKEMLKLGGRKSPKDLLAMMDLDIESPDVWLSGFEQVEATLEKLESSWKGYQNN